MRIARAYWPYIIATFIPFFLLLVLFRELLLHLDTALFDWNDYPLYVWILFQNIEHISNGAITQLFNGAIFYPSPHTMLFSDLFLPQSLVALPISWFTTNPVLVFNTIFILTLLANCASAVYAWSRFDTHKWRLLFASTATVISSFVFQNWYHFQILSLWPLLLTLGFFWRESFTKKRAVIGGLLLSIVLHTSVYYWVLALAAIGLWYGWYLIFHRLPKQERKSFLQFWVLVGSVSVLLSGATLFNYWQTRQYYEAKRDYGEYVTYSAHASDYLFPAHMSSALWGTKIVRLWNQFNQHSGVFPGIVLVGLATIGLFTTTKNKKNTLVGIPITQHSAFFLSLAIVGFVFSLGPRLSFNGVYLGVPLPYHVVLKTIPLVEVIRVTSRWSVFLFMSLIYFSLLGLKKVLNKHTQVIAVSILFAYLLEVYPLHWSFESKPYYTDAHQVMESVCGSKHTVLLEYPMTQFKDGANIVTNLTYRTQMMMASVTTRCVLVNGYSGYIPREYEQYESKLFNSVETNNDQKFLTLLDEKNVGMVKLNKQELYADRVATLSAWLTNEKQFSIVFTDENHLVVKRNHE